MGTTRGLLHALNRVESLVAAIGLVLVAAILLADVLGREFFGSGIFWAPRLASYCTTVAGMLAFSIVVSSGGHLRPRPVDRVFPPRWDNQVNRLADSISAVLCLFMAYHCGLFVHSTLEMDTRAIAIDMPVWIVQIIVPYVFASAAVRYLAYAIFPEIRPEEKGFGE